MAVERVQPGAEAALAAHLEASSWETYLPDLAARLAQGEVVPLSAVGSMEPSASKDGGGEVAEGGVGPAEPPLACGALRRSLSSVGLGRAQLAPGLQSGITLAAAYVLVVVPAAYLGLGQHSPWVMYTGEGRRPALLGSAAQRGDS